MGGVIRRPPGSVNALPARVCVTTSAAGGFSVPRLATTRAYQKKSNAARGRGVGDSSAVADED